MFEYRQRASVVFCNVMVPSKINSISRFGETRTSDKIVCMTAKMQITITLLCTSGFTTKPEAHKTSIFHCTNKLLTEIAETTSTRCWC